VFEVPVTVAVNCCVPPVCNEAEVGLMLTATVGGGSLTVTAAEADLLPSAMLTACTVNVPAVAGAVYMPVPEMVPPVADQETAVLLVPATVAVNCCVPPVESEADGGLMLTEITGGGCCCEAVDAVTPQPAVAKASAIAAHSSN
jgi:hypothetical protein